MRAACLLALATLLPPFASAQKPDKRSGYDRSARATLVHTAIVYVAADDTSQKVAEVTPGHEVVVVERNGPWLKVFANTDTPDARDEDTEPVFGGEQAASPASGWIKDKGVVTPQTASGDTILYGTAANFEALAAEPHPPKDAASAAHLLYRRVWEYFPSSPLDAVSAYRSADIRWQLEKADNSSLPSAHEQEAYLRPQLYDGDFKRLIKAWPGTPEAQRAAFTLLDNKLCGDWQGLPKCPEMESNLYTKYAKDYPDSPAAPEALYNAVYRQGVLATMYEVEDNRKRADAARAKCAELADGMRVRYGQSEWTRRAQSIAYRVAQGVPVYGTDRE